MSINSNQKPLRDLNFKSIQEDVHNKLEEMGCPYFDKIAVTYDHIKEYLALPHNKKVRLLHRDLPNKILGLTMLFDHEKERGEILKTIKNQLYFIIINPILKPETRNFVILHEIGHILLHKNILKTGVALPVIGLDREDYFSHDNYGLSFEAEANIFAVTQLIPNKDIEVLQKKGTLNPQELINKYKVNYRIAKDRINLYKIRQINLGNTGAGSMGDFSDLKQVLTNPQYPFFNVAWG